jgi:hypothetical protein
MRRLSSFLSVGMVLAMVGSFALPASATAKPAWTLKFTGGIAGSASKIKVVNCTQPLPGGNELNPTANFKVGKASYQIQIRVDPPLQSGTRPFGQTAGPSTASINLITSGNSSASWTTGDGNGSLILNADHKSGSFKGRLIGLGANGIATAVTGKFSCPTFTP